MTVEILANLSNSNSIKRLNYNLGKCLRISADKVYYIRFEFATNRSKRNSLVFIQPNSLDV